MLHSGTEDIDQGLGVRCMLIAEYFSPERSEEDQLVWTSLGQGSSHGVSFRPDVFPPICGSG